MGIRRAPTLVALAIIAGTFGLAAAMAAGPLDLGNGGDTHEGIGQGNLKTKLRPGSTYTASAFAVDVQIRPPDALWGGVQYENGDYRFIQLAHFHRAGTPPLTGVGYLTLETAKVATPSVTQTIAHLRATPHVSFGPTRPTRVAGLRGSMFDATITGVDMTKYGIAEGISLAPFTANHHCGFCTHTMHGQTQDVKYAGIGQLFRILVVGVRGKTVVIYVESTYKDQPKYTPAKIFPTFLPYAERMLAKLSFTG